MLPAARARRYVDMEAGYVAENIHLQAVALGLGSTSVGAFDDNQVAKAIQVQSDETPLLLIPVGYVIEQ
jgi:nitroreductase